ncbi:MAG: hypothetical protein NVS9B10_08450 [Nevskia sp.]
MNLNKWVLLALAFAGSTLAAAGEPSPEQQRADLKVAVLKLQVEAARMSDRRIEEGGLRRVALYLGQDASKARIARVLVAIDGGAPLATNLSEPEAEALASDDGLHRLASTHLQPGPHAIHASLWLRAGKAGADAPMLELDYPLVVGDDESRLELRLLGAGLLQSQALELRPWKVSEHPAGWLARTTKTLAPRTAGGLRLFDRGDRDDPEVRVAQNLMRRGQPDEALAQLLSVAAPAAPALPPSYWLATAQAYRALGAVDQARLLCDRLDALKAEPALVASERLQLAQALLARGDTEAAGVQLDAARPRISGYLAADWRFTQAQRLIAEGRNQEAVDSLGEANTDHVDAFRYLSAPTDALRAAQYRRYNLATALVQSGDETRGLSWLDLVGRLDSKDPELLALRDKANLALGWHFLNLKQGRTAVGVLGRVGSEGAFSSPALLGLGWAQLAPAGERLPRTKLVDTALIAPESDQTLTAPIRNSLERLHVLEPELHGAIGPRSFEHEDPPKDRREGLRRALRLWSLLAARDVHEPANQEGLLAIAYAWDQLHDSEHARAAYGTAIDRLVGLKQELAAGEQFVREGHLIEAIDRAPDALTAMIVLDDLRVQPAESAEPLYRRIADHRELAALLARLDGVDAGPAGSGEAAAGEATSEADAALRQQAASLRQALLVSWSLDARMLETQVLALVQAQNRRLEQYLTAARFSAARVDDRTVGEGPTSDATTSALTTGTR